MWLTELLEDLQVSILSFLNHLLLPDLVLLHLQPMQELVRLGKHLWDEGVVIEFFDLPYFSLHLEYLCSSLVNVWKEVLVFQIHTIVFSIIILRRVISWRLGQAFLKIGIVRILQFLDYLLDWIHKQYPLVNRHPILLVPVLVLSLLVFVRPLFTAFCGRHLLIFIKISIFVLIDYYLILRALTLIIILALVLYKIRIFLLL